MPITLSLKGVPELLTDLAQLPTSLGDQAAPIVIAHATAAEQQIKAAYPRRTGALADAMDLEITTTPAATTALVINRHELAVVFEWGSQARHTALGANRGAMPPGHVFIPIDAQQRAAMLAELVTMVEDHGLRVTDDAT